MQFVRRVKDSGLEDITNGDVIPIEEDEESRLERFLLFQRLL